MRLFIIFLTLHVHHFHQMEDFAMQPACSAHDCPKQVAGMKAKQPESVIIPGGVLLCVCTALFCWRVRGVEASGRAALCATCATMSKCGCMPACAAPHQTTSWIASCVLACMCWQQQGAAASSLVLSPQDSRSASMHGSGASSSGIWRQQQEGGRAYRNGVEYL